MSDSEFNSVCKANGFGAVARGELPLIPRGMLKGLVDAAYTAGRKAEREDCAKACEDAAKGTKVELIGIGFAEMLRNRQEEK